MIELGIRNCKDSGESVLFTMNSATIHAFRNNTDDYYFTQAGTEGVDIIKPDDLELLRPYMRRGDLLENIELSGNRSSGLYIFDGKDVINLATDLDDYGCINRQFLVFKEFGPYHWSFGHMKFNNMLCPDVKSTKAYWHCGVYFPSLWVHSAAILEAPGLTVTFQGVEYTINQRFKDFVANRPNENQCHAGDVRYVAGMSDDVLVGVVHDDNAIS